MDVCAVPAKPEYLFVRVSAGLKPLTPLSTVALELEPRATPSATDAEDL